MKKQKHLKPLEDYLRFIEASIAKASTPPRTRGKYKGHSSTDTYKWLAALVVFAWKDIRRVKGRSQAYDENMSIAKVVGMALVVWAAQVQRAKAYDENRPVKNRTAALQQSMDFRTQLMRAVNDEALMGAIWSHQKFRPPFGAEVKGGSFV